ncbi:MAG: LPS export ABC transporter permease LptG [Deferrisomatales bacterium]|nr:LPS export ABC transporter permease LptG [Deferrisomatales bacterium]
MKIVDRHLSGEFFRLFLAAGLTFTGLFLLVEFFEKLRMFLKYEAGATDALLFLLARVPWMVSQVLPMATLLGTLLSVMLLAGQGEITALRCAGVSLTRLLRPYLVCGLVAAGANALIQEVGAPQGFAFAREVQEVRIKKRPPSSLLKSEDLWVRSGTRIIHVGLVAPEDGRLVGVSVAEVQGNRVLRRIDAVEAHWGAEGWVLREAVVREFQPDGTFSRDALESLPYPLEGRPEDFLIADVGPDEASWAQLRRRIDRYRAQGIETRALEVALWAKTSLPLVNVVMPLLGFPFAVRAGRRGGAAAAVVASLCLGFAYWLTLAVGLGLGSAGFLPPPLAAWGGNLLFTVLGAALLYRAERAV